MCLSRQSFILDRFKISLSHPDPRGCEYLIHSGKQFAIQHFLRDCVDHLPVLSHELKLDSNKANSIVE